MARDALRLGIIGVGFGTLVHIPAFQSEGVEVVAVCTRREERGRAAADRFGIPHVFTDYQEMVRTDLLDAVSVVSPVPLHLPMALAALDAGKHVLCEKPLAMDQAQAMEMWRRATDSGLTAMVAHQNRFLPSRMWVKELIDDGFIGPLHMALLSITTGPRDGFTAGALTERDSAALGGGFLPGVGSHYIDCLRHWLGEVTSVTGHVATHHQARVDSNAGQPADATADDTFSFTLHFASGGWATMTGTTAAPFGPGARVEVYGRDGTLVTPYTIGPGFNPRPNSIVLGARPGDEALSELDIPERLRPLTDDRDYRLMAFRLLVREFVRGIRDGISPSPNFYDGLRCQQVLDAVRESSSTGQRVAIPAEVES